MTDKKFKVANPFSLISDLIPKREKAVEDNNETKKKRFKRGSLNFEEELTSELVFSFIQHKNGYSSYRYIPIPELYLFWNTETDEISMHYEKKIIGKLNFVPNSRTFLEMFVKKTIENLK